MAGWVHIVLVGASIVINAYRSGLISYNIPELEEKLRTEPEFREIMIDALIQCVEQDYKKASAELNTCIELILKGYRSSKQQWCYLLSSDTEVGRLCSQILDRFLKKYSSNRLDKRLAVLDPISIPFLGDAQRFNDGLANLFQKLVEIISYHKEKGDVVFVHATGGYKPEAAVAILAANLPICGASTFYIHEHFNQLIRIPALPITFRRWRKFSDMMEQLVSFQILNKEQCIKRFGKRTIEEAIRLGWMEEEDRFIKPTAFGKLLWKKIRK